MDIRKLIEIASYVSMNDMVARLQSLQHREQEGNSELVLPLVGEFSAGKTSLINALADNKQLEISREPTTATIFEVHFGADKQYAQVLWQDGRSETVEDIGCLKRHVQADASLIHVYDTSDKVPSSVVLVDTPGLSSPDTKHKEALMGFLPYADAVLLVADINQQLTRSLTDFVATSQLAGRRTYLVLTQCDTKAKSEIEAAKAYIAENCKLPLGNVVCTSAKNGELDELTKLLAKIQTEKDSIIAQVLERQRQDAALKIKARLEDLLKTPADTKGIEDAIYEERSSLERKKRETKRLTENLKDDIADIQRDAERRFEDTVFNKLDALVAENNVNFDAEARAIINGVCSIVLSEYKEKIEALLRSNAQSESVTDIDLSAYSIDGLSYNLNLNQVGHQYDGILATGAKVAAAAAAVAVVVSTAGGAAAAVAEAGTLEVADIATDVVDTATDVMSMKSNKKLMNRIEQATEFAGKTSDMYTKVEGYNQQGATQMGMQKGLVEGAVGFVTDKLWGKPQRRRHLHMYIDGTLKPEFRDRIESVTLQVDSAVEQSVQIAVQHELDEKQAALEALRQQLAESKSEFETRMSKIREYYNEL